MKICQVEGTLVATARIAGLQNRRLLIVKERGASGKQVAVDPVGCKPGDWVICGWQFGGARRGRQQGLPERPDHCRYHRLLGRPDRPRRRQQAGDGRCRLAAWCATW